MIAVGQHWVSPNGVIYKITAKLRRGWEVSVTSDDGVVTASADDTFRFHDHKFRGLIEEAKLKLYDPSADIDLIAEKLDRRGETALASALDEINQEFVTALRPAQVTRQRQEDMEEQVDSIIEQLEEADDPENIENLQEELEDALVTLEGVKDTVSPPNRVKTVDPVRDTEHISDPDFITQ